MPDMENIWGVWLDWFWESQRWSEFDWGRDGSNSGESLAAKSDDNVSQC